MRRILVTPARRVQRLGFRVIKGTVYGLCDTPRVLICGVREPKSTLDV